MTAAFAKVLPLLVPVHLFGFRSWAVFQLAVRVSTERPSDSVAIRLVRSAGIRAPSEFNVLGMIGIVCERLSEDRHCNVNASIKFHDGIVRPKNLPYFLAVTMLPWRSTGFAEPGRAAGGAGLLRT